MLQIWVEQYLLAGFLVDIVKEVISRAVAVKIYVVLKRVGVDVVDQIIDRSVSSDENYTVFRYFVVPTFDFKQEILSRGPDVEVLTPEWFRQEIMDDIAKMASRYMIPVTDDDGIPYIDDEDEWKYL